MAVFNADVGGQGGPAYQSPKENLEVIDLMPHIKKNQEAEQHQKTGLLSRLYTPVKESAKKYWRDFNFIGDTSGVAPDPEVVKLKRELEAAAAHRSQEVDKAKENIKTNLIGLASKLVEYKTNKKGWAFGVNRAKAANQFLEQIYSTKLDVLDQGNLKDIAIVISKYIEKERQDIGYQSNKELRLEVETVGQKFREVLEFYKDVGLKFCIEDCIGNIGRMQETVHDLVPKLHFLNKNLNKKYQEFYDSLIKENPVGIARAVLAHGRYTFNTQALKEQIIWQKDYEDRIQKQIKEQNVVALLEEYNTEVDKVFRECIMHIQENPSKANIGAVIERIEQLTGELASKSSYISEVLEDCTGFKITEIKGQIETAYEEAKDSRDSLGDKVLGWGSAAAIATAVAVATIGGGIAYALNTSDDTGWQPADDLSRLFSAPPDYQAIFAADMADIIEGNGSLEDKHSNNLDAKGKINFLKLVKKGIAQGSVETAAPTSDSSKETDDLEDAVSRIEQKYDILIIKQGDSAFESLLEKSKIESKKGITRIHLSSEGDFITYKNGSPATIQFISPMTTKALKEEYNQLNLKDTYMHLETEEKPQPATTPAALPEVTSVKETVPPTSELEVTSVKETVPPTSELEVTAPSGEVSVEATEPEITPSKEPSEITSPEIAMPSVEESLESKVDEEDEKLDGRVKWNDVRFKHPKKVGKYLEKKGVMNSKHEDYESVLSGEIIDKKGNAAKCALEIYIGGKRARKSCDIGLCRELDHEFDKLEVPQKAEIPSEGETLAEQPLPDLPDGELEELLPTTSVGTSSEDDITQPPAGKGKVSELEAKVDGVTFFDGWLTMWFEKGEKENERGEKEKLLSEIIKHYKVPFRALRQEKYDGFIRDIRKLRKGKRDTVGYKPINDHIEYIIGLIAKRHGKGVPSQKDLQKAYDEFREAVARQWESNLKFQARIEKERKRAKRRRVERNMGRLIRPPGGGGGGGALGGIIDEGGSAF